MSTVENRVSDSNVQRNIDYNASLHISLTVDTIKSLQSEVSLKMARYANREYSSKKNDLGLCMGGEKAYQKLAEYLKILEELKYCNSCFCDYHSSEIISAVYVNLNNLY